MASGPVSGSDRVFRFGPFELSEPEAELRKNGIRLRLQEQPFQVLVELVAKAGRIVTREQLQQKLWPADTFVDFDTGLNSAIRKLRQALGDDAEEPRYIETYAKRGYRFIAPVEQVQAATVAPSAPVIAAPVLERPVEPTEKTMPVGGKRRPYLAFLVFGVVIVALVVFVLVRSTLPSSPLLSEQRITSNPQGTPVEGGVISPEGKYVAYGDTTGVYVRDIATGETHPLPLPKGEEWIPTSWYPDGIHLLLSVRDPFEGPEYLTPELNDIWRVSILGGPPQKVIESAYAGAVSPDGAKIAFLRGANREDRRQIWVADNGPGDPRQLPLPRVAYPIFSNLVWSPHGTRIAYLRLERFTGSLVDLWTIETVDVKTGATKTVKVSPRIATGLGWSPDGRLLYGYEIGEAGKPHPFGVFALRVNENTGEVEGKEEQISTGTGSVNGMSVDSAGKRLIVWRHSTTPSVFLTDVDLQNGRLTNLRRLTLDENENIVTTWTPDSSAVVFNSDRSGTGKIYRQAIDQAVPELLVDGHDTLQIRAGPGGENFVYMVGGNEDNTERKVSLMSVPVQGGTPRLLLSANGIVDIQCARSSPLCLYSTQRLIRELPSYAKVFSFDSKTGTQQEFPLPDIPDFLEWSLSPDGSMLATIVNGPKLRFVRLADKSTHEVQVPGSWKQLIAIDWAADGKSVYVPSRESDGDYVILQVALTGETRVVLQGGKVPRYVWAIAAPDGRHVAVQTYASDGNLWMLENF